jgi:hypothetical protein
MAAVADFKFDIWRLQAQGDVRGLSLALKDANPDVRRRAATALRALGASSAIPSLQSVLVTESDPDVRSVIISTLDYLFEQEIEDETEGAPEDPTQVVRLIAQLNSPRSDHIIRAAQRLGELNEKIAAEALIMVFHNARLPSEVRLAAAEALIKLESAPVEVSLLRALRHADWRVRRNAAAVLGQLHADWAALPLGEALKDEYEIVRRTALAALKRLDTPEARRVIDRIMLDARSQPPVQSVASASPDSPAQPQPAPSVTSPAAESTPIPPTAPAHAASDENAAKPSMLPAASSPVPVQPPAQPPSRPPSPAVSTATLPVPTQTPAATPDESAPPAVQPPRASVQTVTLPKTMRMQQPPLGTAPALDDEDTQPMLPAPADDAS